MSRGGKNWSDLVSSSQEFFLLAAAHRVGLFFALETEAKDPHNLASELDVDLRAIRILLMALEAMGLCQLTQGGYQLTAVAQTILHAPDHPDSLQAVLPHQFDLMNAFIQLPEVIQSGTPVGMPSEGVGLAHFMNALQSRAEYLVQEAVDALLQRVESARHVLDLGGGPGRYSKAFAQRGLEVTLLERPEVIEYAKGAFGLGDVRGLNIVPGDFINGVPAGPYDIVFLGHVCHLYGPEENRALFRRVADVLRPGGVLGILDFVRGRSPKAPCFAVIMLLRTSDGDTWTEAEYEEWLTDAGLSDVQCRDMGDGESQLCTAKWMRK